MYSFGNAALYALGGIACIAVIAQSGFDIHQRLKAPATHVSEAMDILEQALYLMPRDTALLKQRDDCAADAASEPWCRQDMMSVLDSYVSFLQNLKHADELNLAGSDINDVRRALDQTRRHLIAYRERYDHWVTTYRALHRTESRGDIDLGSCTDIASAHHELKDDTYVFDRFWTLEDGSIVATAVREGDEERRPACYVVSSIQLPLSFTVAGGEVKVNMTIPDAIPDGEQASTPVQEVMPDVR